jgi:erythromycin esterase
MTGREVKGTQDWKKYEIVLDVSPEAVGIYFGMMVVGKGQMWADDLLIEVVGKDVPVTDLNVKKAPKEAQNLGFED